MSHSSSHSHASSAATSALPSVYDHVLRAADYLRTQDARSWQALLVLGSGLGALADDVHDAVRVPYGDIPGFARSTVHGHKGQFVIGELQGVRVAVMQGRMHYYEGHPLWQTTLPVRVAREMGATRMIITNAAGGIHRDFQIGDVMLITDHISFVGMAGMNALVGPNVDQQGPRFPEMTTAYDATFQDLAKQVAERIQVPLQRGVYAGVSGPNFESPAELRFLRMIGADAVGMSTVNEVTVARHCGIRVLGFSGITNVARLSSDEGEPPSHEEVNEAGIIIAPKMFGIIRAVLPEIMKP